MSRISVQDANILIDLVKTGLLHHCLALQYQFTTTDIILEELYPEQAAVIQPHVHSGKFTVISIPAVELAIINAWSNADGRLSPQDWSAVYYAEKQEAILLSGDKQVREAAKKRNIEVCGMLWILDELVDNNVLTATEACGFLKDLTSKNKRLPVNDCNERIEKWCK